MTTAEFQEHIKAFRTFNQSKNLQRRTIKLYDDGLRQFHAWLVENHGGEAEITSRRIREFVAHRRARGNRETTVRTQVYVLRAFFSFLVLDEAVAPSENPMLRVKNPKAAAVEIRPLSIEEISGFLGRFDKGHPTSYRDYVACVLILDTGLRIGEVARLDVEDIEDSKINVRGKGGKLRRVYMGQKMGQLLQDYLERCRPWFANGHKALFPLAKYPESGRLRPGYFSALIRRRLDAAGVPRMNSSGHRLRHTFAYNFLKGGGNVFALQKLLGHSSLEMTKRYVMLADSDLQEAHRKASPVDRMEL